MPAALIRLPCFLTDTAGQSLLSSLDAALTRGSLNPDSASPVALTSLPVAGDVTAGSLTLVLTCQVFVCRQDNTCTQHRQQFVQVVNVSPAGLAHHRALAVLEVK